MVQSAVDGDGLVGDGLVGGGGGGGGAAAASFADQQKVGFRLAGTDARSFREGVVGAEMCERC